MLRLIEKISDGCVVEINETGTSLRYRPGLVTGGAHLQHDCGTSRSMGYFLEPLVYLGLFGKKPISIVLTGITNDSQDPGVDVFRTVTFPLLRQLTGTEDGLELKVVRRGAPPKGGGEVHVSIPVVRKLPPINLTDEGMVKRIRGVAYSMRVPPQTSNRMVDGCRGLLNDLLADVYLFTDHMSGRQAGASPGYGVALVAETTTGRYISAEATASVQAQGEGPSESQVAEEIGRQAASQLLEQIHRGGVVDGTHQGLVLTLCALGPEEFHEVRLGPLTPHAVRTLRHIKDFFGVVFSIRPEQESQTIFLSCIGSGLKNLSKRVT